MAAVANSFQQTDAAPTCGNGGVGVGCSGRSATAHASDAIAASVGGSAGTVPIATGLNASESNRVYFECDCGAMPANYVGVAAQTVSFPINVTTAGTTNFTTTEVWMCRVAADCTSIEVVGSVTGLSVSMTTTGVKTFSVVVATKKVFYPTDRLVFYVVGSNGVGLPNAISFTPDQAISINLLEGVQSDLTTFVLTARGGSMTSSDWGTETRAQTSNDSRATHTHSGASPVDGYTGWLEGAELVTKLGSTKTPGDIYLWVERRNSGTDPPTATVKDSSILMLQNAGQIGADKADAATVWPAADGRVKYTWTGHGLTQSQVDSASFMFRFSAVQDENVSDSVVPEVDAMQATIETDAVTSSPGGMLLRGVG